MDAVVVDTAVAVAAALGGLGAAWRAGRYRADAECLRARLRAAQARYAPGTEVQERKALGTLVLGGERAPVTAIVLQDGGLVVTAVRAGPQPARTGMLTVFDNKGRGVCQESTERTLEGVPAGACAVLTWRFTVASVQAMP